MPELSSPHGLADQMFPLHGPYDPAHTTGAAALIDALARYLNYATRHADALPGPADAYELAGALRIAAGKLPQAFRQLGRRVDSYAATAVDSYAATTGDAEQAGDALRKAGALAQALAAELGRVQLSLRELSRPVSGVDRTAPLAA